MSDRYYALCVVLEKDTRDDDAAPLIEAIKMMRGVLRVEPHITDASQWVADERARFELGQKLWEIVYPSKGKP